MGWVSPTSHTDANAKWSNEANAYDEVTTSYSTNAGADYNEWLQFHGFDILDCTGIKLWAIDFTGGGSANPDVRIEVFDNSDWTLAYDGAITKDVWVERTFASQRVNSVRIKTNDNTYSFFLYELLVHTPDENIPVANCMGHWKCNESSWTQNQAGDVVDSSGNANHGEPKGSVAITASGKVANGGEFESTNASDYVEIPTSGTLEIGSSAFSLSLWIYPETVVGWDCIVEKGAGSAAINYGVWFANTSKIDFITAAGAYGDLYSSAALSTGTWYHIVVTWDGSTKRLWIDGVPSNAVSIAGNTIPKSDTTTFKFGNSRGGAYWYDGTLDSVALFDIALNGGQIGWLYNGGAGREYTNTALLRRRIEAA